MPRRVKRGRIEMAGREYRIRSSSEFRADLTSRGHSGRHAPLIYPMHFMYLKCLIVMGISSKRTTTIIVGRQSLAANASTEARATGRDNIP